MYQNKIRFKDSKGKTRNVALVTYDYDHYIVDIQGTATEQQIFEAIDGGATSSGALTIEWEYIEQGAQ